MGIVALFVVVIHFQYDIKLGFMCIGRVADVQYLVVLFKGTDGQTTDACTKALALLTQSGRAQNDLTDLKCNSSPLIGQNLNRGCPALFSLTSGRVAPLAP